MLCGLSLCLGRCPVVSSAASGGFLRWSSSRLTPLTWRRSWPSSGCSRPSSPPKIWPSRPRSSTERSSREPRGNFSGSVQRWTTPTQCSWRVKSKLRQSDSLQFVAQQLSRATSRDCCGLAAFCVLAVAISIRCKFAVHLIYLLYHSFICSLCVTLI